MRKNLLNLILKFTIKQKANYGECEKLICTFFEDYKIGGNDIAPETDFRMPSEHTQTIGYVLGFFIGKMIVSESFNAGNFFLLFLISFLQI